MDIPYRNSQSGGAYTVPGQMNPSGIGSASYTMLGLPCNLMPFCQHAQGFKQVLVVNCGTIHKRNHHAMAQGTNLLCSVYLCQICGGSTLQYQTDIRMQGKCGT